MSVVVITPPDEDQPVVSLAEAKVQLRVDHDDDDDYIESLIAVATATIDGPDGWLGLALMRQTLECSVADFCEVRLLYPPVSSIVSVKYDDAAGVEQTVPDSDYRLVGASPSRRPRLVPAPGKAWPQPRCQAGSVRVRYVAGFGEEGCNVPAPIRHAILMMVAELYEVREAAGDAARFEYPFAVMSLLSTYRVFG
jgi:uncharacterized phiE125 gp8 family phage protein